MGNNGTVKGTKKLTSTNTLTNALSFMVDQTIKNLVNTAEVVSITEADQNGTQGQAGYATVTPLVCQTDAYDNTLAPAPLHHLPYFRPQAGKAAIIMDPQPGDKAVLIAMQRDSTGVSSGKNEPVQPASFRSYDLADGYLLNGFLGEKPELWLQLDPVSGDISLSTKSASIDISCRESGDIIVTTGSGNITIQCTDTATIKSPTITLDGNVTVTGNMTVEGKSQGKNGSPARFSTGIINESGGIRNAGGFTNSGGMSNTGGSMASNGVTVETHTHSGVYTGNGSTGKPNGGS